MNAILVVTPQPAYLDEVKKWIERLDRGGDAAAGLQFYVYHLQNTRAERLAPLLQQAFTGRVTQPQTPSAPTLAPGTPAGTIVNPPTFRRRPTPSDRPPPAAVRRRQPGDRPVGAAAPRRAPASCATSRSSPTRTPIRCSSIATAAEYAVIEQALRKLDIPQRQVIIEVTIAEVTLTDDLQFGVDWLFKGGAPSGRGAGGLLTRHADHQTR